MVVVEASDTVQYECNSGYFPTPCDQYAIVCDTTISEDISGTIRLKMTIIPDMTVEVLVKYAINGTIIDDTLFYDIIYSGSPQEIIKDISVDLKAGDVISVAIMNKCYYGSSGYDYQISPFQICFDSITPCNLIVSSTPEGANIYIDDVLQTSVTPATISGLTEGTHTYRLTLDGYNDAVGTFNMSAGQTTTIVEILEPAITTGTLDISSTPEGANIYIDDTIQTATTPATITDLIEGTHTYRLTLDGYNDATGTFDIVAGQTTMISEVLEPITKDGRLGPLIISTLTLGMILPAKDCNKYTTKEECEKHGCKWEDGKCIKR